jgi:hypothetical protein
MELVPACCFERQLFFLGVWNFNLYIQISVRNYNDDMIRNHSYDNLNICWTEFTKFECKHMDVAVFQDSYGCV